MCGKKKLMISLVCFLILVFGSLARAEQWQVKYPKITLGAITSENEADRVQRYKPVRKYLEKELGIKILWRTATDYAGIIEGVKAGASKNIIY